MSHGARPAPAARLVLLLLGTLIAIPLHPCLGGGPPTLPDSALGHHLAPLLLLSRPDVRADVGLSGQQVADAERALAELLSRAAALVGKTGPNAVAGRRAIDEAQEQWLKAHLSDAQRKRLVEVDLQWEGASALISRPVVTDHIGLTPDQQERLKRAISERDQRLSKGENLFECESLLSRQTLTLLTPEQRTRWKAMLGRDFTPQLADSRAKARH